jgi:hypothetical protein
MKDEGKSVLHLTELLSLQPKINNVLQHAKSTESFNMFDCDTNPSIQDNKPKLLINNFLCLSNNKFDERANC